MKSKVLVVGTYHLNPTDDMVEMVNGEKVLRPNREKEIKEIINRFRAFQPTKVTVEVEVKYQDKLHEQYLNYINNSFPLPINEVYQIGFRLAKAMNHETVYAIDWMEIIGQRSVGQVLEWAEANQRELYQELQNLSSKIAFDPTAPLLEILRVHNEPERVKLDHEFNIHLARIAEKEDYVGIDWLRWWYQRNLITFSNIANLIENENERIFLIIGSAHVHLVNQFLRESNMFEVEDANKYLY